MPSKAKFYHIWTLGRKQTFSSFQFSLLLESETPPWSRLLLWEEWARGFAKLFRWRQVPIHSGKIPYPNASVWARSPADRGSSSYCMPFPCGCLPLLMFPGSWSFLPGRGGGPGPPAWCGLKLLDRSWTEVAAGRKGRWGSLEEMDHKHHSTQILPLTGEAWSWHVKPPFGPTSSTEKETRRQWLHAVCYRLKCAAQPKGLCWGSNPLCVYLWIQDH